jgi:hypothetical protein
MTRMMTMKMARIALLFMSAWLAGAGSALAQTTPFSTYVLGLAPASSVSGVERLFALQSTTPKTVTPIQILSLVTGDCTIAAPPSIVCTKFNGVNFVASATTDTTNAANISSGSLSLSRLALTSAFFYVGNGSNNPAGVAMSGDCTLANTGAVTCTKTSGSAFVASATTDTTNAANISSGTLAGARYAAANLAAGGNGGVTGVLPFANQPTGSLNTVLGYWSSTTLAATAVPNCTTGALQFNTTTHVFSCNVGGGAGSVTSAQIAAGTGIGVSGTCTITTTGVCTVATSLSTLPNSLSADVAMNNTGLYFDGPNVAQGTSGTWFASGTVTLTDVTGIGVFFCKLWDGTTVISSNALTANVNTPMSLSLSGQIASPAGNIRISCIDSNTAGGKILFNQSGNSKDSTITVFRIQ